MGLVLGINTWSVYLSMFHLATAASFISVNICYASLEMLNFIHPPQEQEIFVIDLFHDDVIVITQYMSMPF